MTASLIPFAKNVAVFALSISAGIFGYVLFSPAPSHSIQTGSPSALSSRSFGSGLVAFFSRDDKSGWDDQLPSFPDEPVFITKLNDPVDLGRDAAGVSYFLERGGRVMRLGVNTEGNRKLNCFAKLETKNSLNSTSFSAIAFHPEFLSTGDKGYGRFYVVASEKAGSGKPDFYPAYVNRGTEHHQDVLYEYQTANPFSPAFLGKRREILRLSQPGPEDNFTSLAFDSRGFLYLGVGDGAELTSRHPDISKNASSLLSVYGKILRIDPLGRDSTNGQYGIPLSNPFRLVADALPELWAYGLRAPHSLSINPFNEWLFISEEGQSGTAELNVSRFGAEHFGWDLLGGGSHIFTKLLVGSDSVLTPPEIQFAAPSGKASTGQPDEIPCTGGFVYSGEHFPSLVGKMIFGDHRGRIMAAPVKADDHSAVRKDSIDLLADEGFFQGKEINALRPGPLGEIFVLCKGGEVFEIGKGATAAIPRKSRRPLICSVSLFPIW